MRCTFIQFSPLFHFSREGTISTMIPKFYNQRVIIDVFLFIFKVKNKDLFFKSKPNCNLLMIYSSTSEWYLAEKQ